VTLPTSAREDMLIDATEEALRETPADRRALAGLRGNVLVLGWVSFFGGLSQDMILPILPLFLANALGLPKTTIGLIEGAVSTTVSALKILAGYLSDRWQRRKPLVFTGYALSAVARPGLALLGSGGTAGAAGAFGLRFLDGVGKGVKDAPRDALIAGSSDAKKFGLSFGYHRMLDTFGSVAGPGATFLILAYLDRRGFSGLGGGDLGRYRLVFLLAGIPAAATLVLIARSVIERHGDVAAAPRLSLRIMDRPFALFLGIMLLFTLGNSSDAFLLLRAQNIGVAVVAIPLVYALFNLSYGVLALPAGILSDRIGRRLVLLGGWGIYALSYLGFAVAGAPWQVWFLYVLYGLYYAGTEGVAKALVADVVGGEHRGTAYGLYNAAIGVMALPASVIAGLLWDHVSPAAPFYFGAATAAGAMILLAIWRMPVRTE
jgi:MFS family permease